MILAAVEWKQLIENIAAFLLLAFALGAGIGAFRYGFNRRRDTLNKQDVESIENSYKLQMDLMKSDLNTVKKELAECGAKHDESTKQITELNARLDHVHNIPLQKIAEHIERSSTILIQLTALLQMKGVLVDQGVPSGK